MIQSAETLIIEHLLQECAEGSVIKGTFDVVDMTDDTASPVIARLALEQIRITAQTQKNCRSELSWTITVYCDLYRSTAVEKAAADELLVDCLTALVGWEFCPGREVQIQDGAPTDFNGRLLALSFGFSIPAHFIGAE